MLDLALPFLVACVGLVLVLSPQAVARTWSTTRRQVVGRRGSAMLTTDGRTGTFRMLGLMVLTYAVLLVVLQAP